MDDEQRRNSASHCALFFGDGSYFGDTGFRGGPRARSRVRTSSNKDRLHARRCPPHRAWRIRSEKRRHPLSTLRPAQSTANFSLTPLADAAATALAMSRCTGKFLKAHIIREITFLPDRVDGRVQAQGKSTIQVHGMFGIHGATHELTIPVQIEMAPDHWSARAHFVVPYVQWGMKNPSTFILRVSQSVDIDVQASGPIPAGGQ